MASRITRHRDRFNYYSVSIRLDSPIIKRLQEDVDATGVRYVAQMIAIRVRDYYNLVDSLSNMRPVEHEPEVIDAEAGIDDLVEAYGKYDKENE